MENLVTPNCIVPIYHSESAFSQTSRVRKLRLLAWAIETILLLLTIGLGFNFKREVQRSIVAVVTHVLFSTVTTGFVFWNKSLRRGVANLLKFWISNVLLLAKPLSFWNKRDDEKREELCVLETKLKGSYTRLLVSFFTIIPACILQYYFLFQSGRRIYRKPCAFDVLRIATVATGLFNTTTSVYEYDDLTIEYELQSEIEAANSPVEFRTGFWRYFNYICQRVTLTAFLLCKSPYFALIYTISNWTTNHVILKHMPHLENPYVNAPHGTHSNASFWTFRIINIISGIGTRLNLDLLLTYYSALVRGRSPSVTIWMVLFYHMTQFLFIVLSSIILYLRLTSFHTFIYAFSVYFITADIMSLPLEGSNLVVEYTRGSELDSRSVKITGTRTV